MGRRKQAAPQAHKPFFLESPESQDNSCMSLIDTQRDMSNKSTISVDDIDDEDYSISDAPTTSKSKLECSICHKLFKHKKSLQRHVQLHSGIRKHKCTLCHAAFVRSDHLRSHIKTHLSKKRKDLHFPLVFNKKCKKTETKDVLNKYQILQMSVDKDDADEINVIDSQDEADANETNEKQDNNDLLTTSPPIKIKVSESSSNVPVICPICMCDFQTMPIFVSHMTTKHGQTERLQKLLRNGPPGSAQSWCSLCGGLVNNKAESMYHLIIHCMQLKIEYQCSACDAVHADMSELEKHSFEKHCSRVYKCSLCSQVFDTESAMKEHFMCTHFTENKISSCSLCHADFRDPSLLYDHFISKHLHTEFKLIDDNNATNENHKIITSKSTENGESEIDSGKKKTSFPSSSSNIVRPTPVFTLAQPTLPPVSPFVMTHMVQEMSRVCNYCFKTFPDEMSVLSHQVEEHRLPDAGTNENVSSAMETADNSKLDSLNSNGREPSPSSPDVFTGRQFICSYCGLHNRSFIDLEKHLRTHYQPSSLKCNICDEKFPNVKVLQDHKLTHRKGNGPPGTPKRCCFCLETFYGVSKLENHLETDHKEMGARRECLICGKVLGSLRRVLEHCELHLYSEPVAFCRSCNKPLPEGSNCGSQVISLCEQCNRSSYKAIICPLCIQTFDNTTQLRLHLATHSSGSGGDYSKPANMGDRHLPGEEMKHAGKGLASRLEKGASFCYNKVNGKFICQVCDRSFVSEDDLTSHRLVHLHALVRRSPKSDADAASSDENSPTHPTEQNTVNHEIVPTSPPVEEKNSPKKNYRSCGKCGKKFTSWKSKLLHQRRQHTDKTSHLSNTDDTAYYTTSSSS